VFDNVTILVVVSIERKLFVGDKVAVLAPHKVYPSPELARLALSLNFVNVWVTAVLESADVVIEETVPATMVLPFAAVHESFIVIDNEESVIVLDVGSLKTVFSNSE
jgi:hypothetical protein